MKTVDQTPRLRSQYSGQYCAGQVVLLPGLLQHYDGKLDLYWRLKVDVATEERLRMVKSAFYDPGSACKSRGPWPQDGSSEDYLDIDECWDDIFDAIFPDDEDDAELAELFSYLNCGDVLDYDLTDMFNDLDCQDDK